MMENNNTSEQHNNIFNIQTIIDKVKDKRKAFVSEADFQLEFAWAIKEKHPEFKVRLEYVPEFDRKMHIDILVITDEGWIPIELKYKTKGCTVKEGNETYVLANHGAKDVNCYLYLKDIQRIEYIKKKKGNQFVEGYTVMLTNEESYMKEPKNSNVIYAAFSIHDRNKDGKIKNEKHGLLSWGENAGGTKSGHDDITLEGKYKMHWEKYSEVDDADGSEKVKFHYLWNKIEGES